MHLIVTLSTFIIKKLKRQKRMNKLEKMRRLIIEGRRHSILCPLPNEQTPRRSSLQMKYPQIQKQTKNKFTLISVLNFETDLENSSFNFKNQEKKTADCNISQNGLSLKLKKMQNYHCSSTMREQKNVHYDTIQNVSSLITKHVGGHVRINKASFNRKVMKSMNTRVSLEEETQTLQNKDTSIQFFVSQKSKTSKKSPKKLAYRTVYKAKRTISPKKHSSPPKGMKLVGWQVSQEPQFEWQ